MSTYIRPDGRLEGRLLLVEDDLRIGFLLRSELEARGLDVVWSRDLHQARSEVETEIDLALVDLGLPDGDGVDLVRELRRAQPTVVIVILTARDEEIDVLVGLDAGADDYLVKPVRVAELTARIQAHLRRSSVQPIHHHAQLQIGSLTFDLAARRVYLGTSELTLRYREYDLLVRLATDSGEAVSREVLMDDVWDVNWFGSTKTLDVHVAALRRILGEATHATGLTAPSIIALRGFGYRLDP